MFLRHKTDLARLAAMERNLEERTRDAARRGHRDEVLRLSEMRRRVRRAILLRQEFMGDALQTTVTIAELFATG